MNQYKHMKGSSSILGFVILFLCSEKWDDDVPLKTWPVINGDVEKRTTHHYHFYY